MTRPVRILLVTAGLSAVGTLLGAIAGAVALALAFLLSGPEPIGLLIVLGYPALIGAVLGGTLGPVIAWALLRAVPLGVAFVATTVGTVLGGVAGWLVATLTNDLLYTLYGAAAGLVLSAILLRMRYGKPTFART